MLKKWVFVILLLPFIVISLAYLLPNKTEVSRSIIIERNAQSVFDMVNNFKNSQRWSPWADKDPNIEVSYQGPISSGGARMSWKSENSKVGSGSQEIIESKPLEFVHIRLEFDGQESADAFFKLEPQGLEKTKLTWSFAAEHGDNPINRYMGLMIAYWVGSDYEKGLMNLKTLLEQPDDANENIVEPVEQDKIQMVNEKGQVLDLTKEEMEALNKKSIEQGEQKVPENIQKMIEETIKQKELEQQQAQKEQEEQAKKQALEAEATRNTINNSTTSGKEDY